MTWQAIAMMAAVCGLVWGGFAACLLYIMRRERGKARRRRVG
ncbi:MAG: MetS family NSS transporter small subunit [Candidatus Krumholzibacteria bacterium]|nr:MetS family NSS transporter small subunit [Candidatus Krumholzibacteria bacterium]